MIFVGWAARSQEWMEEMPVVRHEEEGEAPVALRGLRRSCQMVGAVRMDWVEREPMARTVITAVMDIKAQARI